MKKYKKWKILYKMNSKVKEKYKQFNINKLFNCILINQHILIIKKANELKL